MAADATAFLQLIVGQIVADGKVTPEEVQGLHRLQRRLGLAEVRILPIERLHDVVERKIETMLIERAAYLSAPGLLDTVKTEIAAYSLPPERQQHLFDTLARQHVLAQLMAGHLPIVRPVVELYRDEVCHVDQPATFEPAQSPTKDTASGRLVVTNLRLMFLSPRGGLALQWQQVSTIVPLPNGITVLSHPHSLAQRDHAGRLLAGTVYCEDPQYMATLIAAARRLYTTPAPQPVPPNKRLSP